VVTETASVHPDDRPYERAPLAADCGPGWAPSRVPDVATREMPMEMEDGVPGACVRPLPALDSLQLSRPWYLRGPAAWHPRTGRPAAAAPGGAPTA
jgi:hypothetical protein